MATFSGQQPSSMEGTEGLQELFPQVQARPAWSSPDAAPHQPALEFFSQGASSDGAYHQQQTGQHDNDINLYLDLNSQAPEYLTNTFPHIDAYQELLKSRRHGRGATTWRPPRQSGSGGRGGRGGRVVAPKVGRGAASNAGRGATPNAGRGAPPNAGRGAAPNTGRGAAPNTGRGRGAAPSVGRGRGTAPSVVHPSASSSPATSGTQSDAADGMDDEDDIMGNDAMVALSSSDDEDDVGAADPSFELALQHQKRKRRYANIAIMLGTHYFDSYMNKAPNRQPEMSGLDWVMRTLNNPKACYNMYRMTRGLFDRLHCLLVESYGLKASCKMESIEALAMFLWIIGAPQSVRQVENRFERSLETVSRKFDEVLECVCKLAKDIVKPRDAQFRTVHPRLKGARFTPYFDNCIGAIDGTHVLMVVPTAKVVQYTGRRGYTSQNVLAICDFDMRFTFVVAGWPGSVHDMRVFNDAVRKYASKFPHPPPGKFYLVDSGYPNRPGYLAPYKGTKYHLPEFQQGPQPKGRKEVYNFAHSSLRNVIERSFGVLKMKWRILLYLPSYPEEKQTMIIHACMALHNFIRENAIDDADFARFENNENYVASHGRRGANMQLGDEDINMNPFRDNIDDALFARR